MLLVPLSKRIVLKSRMNGSGLKKIEGNKLVNQK